MGPYTSALIAFVALLFAYYQWKRSTGRVRVDVSQIQATLYLRVTSDTPSDISIDAIGYMVARGRWPVLRFLFSRSAFTMRQRLRQVYQGLFIDLAAGWMGVEGSDDIGGSMPLSGPTLPAELERYHGIGWHLEGGDQGWFGKT
jgi:hypothetical protein